MENDIFTPLVTLWTATNEIVVKHIFDLDYDMNIVSDDGLVFYVNMNDKFRYAKRFLSLEAAELFMTTFATQYNEYEQMVRENCS